MPTQIKLGNITVDVVWKDIKNIHLSVRPPAGRVTIAAPRRLDIETLRVFAISKIGWIRLQQRKLLDQEREAPREYLDRESHYVWGRRHLMKVVLADLPPGVELVHNRLILRVRPDWDKRKMSDLMEAWYREQLRAALLPLVAKWQRMLGIHVDRCYVQHMKTKWGSCNPRARAIRLNTELAKKPRECLEYIVVHELAHLLERHHNDRFSAIMDKHLPHWRLNRQELNAAPLGNEQWIY